MPGIHRVMTCNSTELAVDIGQRGWNIILQGQRFLHFLDQILNFKHHEKKREEKQRTQRDRRALNFNRSFLERQLCLLLFPVFRPSFFFPRCSTFLRGHDPTTRTKLCLFLHLLF